jgi:hypothetical protein
LETVYLCVLYFTYLLLSFTNSKFAKEAFRALYSGIRLLPAGNPPPPPPTTGILLFNLYDLQRFAATVIVAMVGNFSVEMLKNDVTSKVMLEALSFQSEKIANKTYFIFL